jgi:hypothetical protein
LIEKLLRVVVHGRLKGRRIGDDERAIIARVAAELGALEGPFFLDCEVVATQSRQSLPQVPGVGPE